MSQATPLLELRDIALERDDRLLFHGLSLRLFAGQILQVLGPNGTGKTSLLRVLARLSNDFAGSLWFQGRNLRSHAWEFASNCLYLGHAAGIKKALTPLENLRWYAAQLPSCITPEAALAEVGLEGYEDTPCQYLSAGQQRRVALARLHMSQALVWILDEPFTAIDKAGVSALEQLIARQSERGGLVILTSHQDLALPQLQQINLLDYRASLAAGEEGAYV